MRQIHFIAHHYVSRTDKWGNRYWKSRVVSCKTSCSVIFDTAHSSNAEVLISRVLKRTGRKPGGIYCVEVELPIREWTAIRVDFAGYVRDGDLEDCILRLDEGIEPDETRVLLRPNGAKPTAREILRFQFGGARNFMTPHGLKVYQHTVGSTRWAIELATGIGMDNEPIYGVSVVGWNGHNGQTFRPIGMETAQKSIHYSRAEAERWIEDTLKPKLWEVQ